MTESGSWQNVTPPRDEGIAPPGATLPLWRRIRQVVARAFFWSYERGSWQYDVIVIVILAFIFLTPRSWYSDRPTLQLTDLRHRQGVIEVGRGDDGWRYLIDSRLVQSLEPLQPEEAIQELLHRRLNRPFKIQSIGVNRDQNNVVLSYTVLVNQ